jgi:RHS repeat-associated protein
MPPSLQPLYVHDYSYAEQFTYDSADRLTGWTIVNSTSYTADYSGNGNIVRKSDFGMYAYSSSKPHAVSGISSLIAGTGTERTCEAEYNTIGKVSKLVLKNGSTTLKTATFTYAADGQRRKMQIGSNTTIYVDDYQVNKNGNTEQRLHYISGPAGLCALIVHNYNGNSLTSRATYYLQTDYQGSIIAAYNSYGTLYKRFAYDPWGRRRNGSNWTNYQTETETLITRGYCGHEHLDDFGTINMNGRIYDPRLGRFLSPDPYVQAPYNSQNYNRYAYCLNNPLKYTDPDGESFIVAAAIIIGAAIGAHTGYKIAKCKGYDWNDKEMWVRIIGGGVVGGVAGWCGASVATSVMASSIAAGAGTIEASAVAGGMSGLVGGAINGGGMALISGGDAIDVIGGIMQGGCIGAFSGLAGGAVSAGVTQLTNKLPGILTRFLAPNTLSYLGGSVASKSMSNILTGNTIFDDMDDIFKDPGLAIPLYADISCHSEYLRLKFAKKNNNTDYEIKRTMKFLSMTYSDDNGNLKMLCGGYGEKMIPEYTKYVEKFNFSKLKFTYTPKVVPAHIESKWFFYNDIYIKNYSSLINFLLSIPK